MNALVDRDGLAAAAALIECEGREVEQLDSDPRGVDASISPSKSRAAVAAACASWLRRSALSKQREIDQRAWIARHRARSPAGTALPRRPDRPSGAAAARDRHAAAPIPDWPRSRCEAGARAIRAPCARSRDRSREGARSPPALPVRGRALVSTDGERRERRNGMRIDGERPPQAGLGRRNWRSWSWHSPRFSQNCASPASSATARSRNASASRWRYCAVIAIPTSSLRMAESGKALSASRAWRSMSAKRPAPNSPSASSIAS